MNQDETHRRDRALARRCATRDPEALAAVVRDCGPFLACVVSKVLGKGPPDRSVSPEDVVGEVFLHLLEQEGKAWRAYQGRCSLKSYLGAIAYRVAVDALRRGGMRACLPLPIGIESPEAPAEADSTNEASLSQALASLSEVDRKAITLRYLEGCTFRQVAARLGVPLGTAAARLARARERLRALGRKRAGNRE